MSKYGGLINLPFEAAACSRMILINRISSGTGIYDLFKENVDAVYYTSWKEALRKIKYFESNQDEMKSIAQNGWNQVIQNHTLGNRLLYFCSHPESLERSK